MPEKRSVPELSLKLDMPWLYRLVYLLDEQFRVPGTKLRFGVDPLMNLFPIVGDLTGFVVAGGLIVTMATKGASNKLVVLMCINIFLDATIGAIPVIGQIFDFFFKANSRNFNLMKEHYYQGKHQGSGKKAAIRAVILTLIILSVMFILLVFGLVKLTQYIIHLF